VLAALFAIGTLLTAGDITIAGNQNDRKIPWITPNTSYSQ
jgi:hypothetical protein